ncbi:hypothetical protein [Streptomyces sp. 5-10]|uniref:hypothetical protein n=1 Tax=Streptomyces sp. 5-10 TaxID=878925 RepID=UPI00168BEC75|nr:hypothetical protein [Streptomyces sp. 5-10]MBD3004715.1 hypothetical protein [Streptomyces sp. 5-10]
MSDIIPYTHWAYFPDRGSAQVCVSDLQDYVTRIDPPIEGSPQWLLRAGRDVSIDGLLNRHDEVEAIVSRYGGRYDGGEAAHLSVDDGLQPIADPALSDASDPRGDGEFTITSGPRVFHRVGGWVLPDFTDLADCATNFQRQQDGRPLCAETAVWKVVEDHGMYLTIRFYCDVDLPNEHRQAAT